MKNQATDAVVETVTEVAEKAKFLTSKNLLIIAGGFAVGVTAVLVHRALKNRAEEPNEVEETAEAVQVQPKKNQGNTK